MKPVTKRFFLAALCFGAILLPNPSAHAQTTPPLTSSRTYLSDAPLGATTYPNGTTRVVLTITSAIDEKPSFTSLIMYDPAQPISLQITLPPLPGTTTPIPATVGNSLPPGAGAKTLAGGFSYDGLQCIYSVVITPGAAGWATVTANVTLTHLTGASAAAAASATSTAMGHV